MLQIHTCLKLKRLGSNNYLRYSTLINLLPVLGITLLLCSCGRNSKVAFSNAEFSQLHKRKEFFKLRDELVKPENNLTEFEESYYLSITKTVFGKSHEAIRVIDWIIYTY
jgi:hypothetical protein